MSQDLIFQAIAYCQQNYHWIIPFFLIFAFLNMLFVAFSIGITMGPEYFVVRRLDIKGHTKDFIFKTILEGNFDPFVYGSDSIILWNGVAYETTTNAPNSMTRKQVLPRTHGIFGKSIDTWTFEIIQEAKDDCFLFITKEGRIDNPIIRFIDSLLWGVDTDVMNYLNALGSVLKLDVIRISRPKFGKFD